MRIHISIIINISEYLLVLLCMWLLLNLLLLMPKLNILNINIINLGKLRLNFLTSQLVRLTQIEKHDPFIIVLFFFL